MLAESERRRRFRQRVDIERSVIHRVNLAFGGGPQLVGVSEAAIKVWMMGMRRHCETAKNGEILLTLVEEVGGVLMRIGEIVRSQADRSRVVFDPPEVDPQAIEAANRILDSALSRSATNLAGS